MQNGVKVMEQARRPFRKVGPYVWSLISFGTGGKCSIALASLMQTQYAKCATSMPSVFTLFPLNTPMLNGNWEIVGGSQ